MIVPTMVTLFGAIVSVVFYVFAIYPLCLYVLSRTCKMPHYKATKTFSVSLIIAAYNEEKIIASKIENSLMLDYPKHNLEIIVFSDGSTDRTDEIVKNYAPLGVKLVRIEGRKGKVFCKNEVARMARGDIIVFSDANSMYERDALKHLIKHFSNPAVGCVAGELRYTHKETVIGEGLYWKYEQWVKRLEGKLGNLTTVNGAIYAVRKDVYEPLPLDVPDDFATTLLIKLKGLKVVHEPQAVAWEETAPDVRSELQRRIRIVTQASYCLFRKPEFRRLLNPFKYGFFSLQLWSHKVLRWFTGVFLALAFLSNALLLREGLFFAITFWGQVLLYLLALWGIVQEYSLRRKTPKLVHTISYFVLSCYGMLRGLWNGLRGKTFITWTPAR